MNTELDLNADPKAPCRGSNVAGIHRNGINTIECAAHEFQLACIRVSNAAAAVYGSVRLWTGLKHHTSEVHAEWDAIGETYQGLHEVRGVNLPTGPNAKSPYQDMGETFVKPAVDLLCSAEDHCKVVRDLLEAEVPGFVAAEKAYEDAFPGGMPPKTAAVVEVQKKRLREALMATDEVLRGLPSEYLPAEGRLGLKKVHRFREVYRQSLDVAEEDM